MPVQSWLQSSKECNVASSNRRFENVFWNKLLSEEEFPFQADSRMETILSFNLDGKSLLRKQIYGYFERWS